MPKTSISNDLANLSNSSQQSRDAALLRATTELFLHGTEHDHDEIRRYEELATHFLPRVSMPDRAYVAERLAPRADAPVAVIRILAKDHIDVARQVLCVSPVLQSLDLLTVIAATGSEHHRMIAQRDRIGADVERALRLMGDGETSATIDRRREEAKSGPVTPMPASKKTTTGGPHSSGLSQRPAGSTRTNPDQLGFQAFLGLDRANRLRLMADLTTRPPARRYGGPTSRLDQAFRSILGAAQIVSFARRSQRLELIAAIAEGLGLDAGIVETSIDDSSGETFLVLLKALGLDNIQAQQVLLLATPAIGRDVKSFFKLTDVFAALESFVAESLVSAWRGEAPSPGRHDPVFAENGSRRQLGTPIDIRHDKGLPAQAKIAKEGSA